MNFTMTQKQSTFLLIGLKSGGQERLKMNNSRVLFVPGLYLAFNENVLILYELFGEKCFELRKNFDSLFLSKEHDEDWMTHTSCINSAFELCDFSTMLKDYFKRLLYFDCSSKTS
ncbi:unnamed protein product [Hymenolepis diminuta]|uniref:Uncharacterized protein n=1 Tax=Hymenolepis diminuta TaxID=6216 RepID=A0A564Z3K4_HYMDI|nr:unnamed protein product [Hymenolepis diminuta]